MVSTVLAAAEERLCKSPCVMYYPLVRLRERQDGDLFLEHIPPQCRAGLRALTNDGAECPYFERMEA